ncbi:MAG: porin family protein [Alphaproteobacteria bacterium]|nr:porin family protein [Alphaproteobacteria bacterium]
MFAVPHPAGAQESRSYAGLEYTSLRADYANSSGSSLDDSYGGLGVYAGARFTDRFGAELSYKRLEADDSATTAGVKLNSFGADGLFFFPLSDSPVEAIVTAGIVRASIEYQLTRIVPARDGPLAVTSKVDDTDTLFRAGIGMQINASENVGIRGLVRYYPQESFDDTVKSATEFTLGFNISF